MTKFVTRIAAIVEDRDGSVAVEAAIMIPLVILFAITAMDMSLAILANHQANTAAHAGTLYAASYGVASQTDLNNIQNACRMTDPAGSLDKGYIALACDPPTAYYCACQVGGGQVGGTPPASCSTTPNCTSSSGYSSLPGTFVTVTARASYTPFSPFLGAYYGGTIAYTSTASVRVN